MDLVSFSVVVASKLMLLATNETRFVAPSNPKGLQFLYEKNLNSMLSVTVVAC